MESLDGAARTALGRGELAMARAAAEGLAERIIKLTDTEWRVIWHVGDLGEIGVPFESNSDPEVAAIVRRSIMASGGTVYARSVTRGPWRIVNAEGGGADACVVHQLREIITRLRRAEAGLAVNR